MAIDGITEVEARGFEIVEDKVKHKWQEYYNRLDLVFMMNKDLVRIERQVLNTFDLLGNVGGVQGLLTSIAVSILSIINFQKPENKLVSNLYGVKRRKGKSEAKQKDKEKAISASS